MKIIIIKEGGEQLPLPSTFLAILVLSRNKRHHGKCRKVSNKCLLAMTQVGLMGRFLGLVWPY